MIDVLEKYRIEILRELDKEIIRQIKDGNSKSVLEKSVYNHMTQVIKR